jgi:exosortase
MSQASSHSSAAGLQADVLRGPLVAAGVLLGLLIWLFHSFFSQQFRWATQQQADWGHTLVIPLIAGYFIYLKRDALRARPFRTTWVGFLPVLIGVAIYMISVVGPQVLHHHNIRGLGVGLTVFGIVLLFCGFRAMLILWVPLAYVFVFGQTISDRFMQLVTFTLQDITASGAYYALLLLNFDVELRGNIITVFDQAGAPRPLNVAEACSGMRMLMAFLALGVAMAYIGLKHLWQQVALVLMGIPTAIFVNVLRVVTLSLLALVGSDFAAGDFHSFVGLVWLVPAFLMFLGIMWIIRRLVTDDAEQSKEPSAV